MPEFGFLSVVEPVFAGIWEFPNGLSGEWSLAFRRFGPVFGLSPLSILCGPQERLRPVPYLARVCGEAVGVGDCQSE